MLIYQRIDKDDKIYLMRKYFIILLLFFLYAAVFSAEIDDFISKSKRSENLIIIEIIKSASFTEKISAMNALGEREDKYFNDILISILDITYGENRNENEYLLSILLESFLINSKAVTQEIVSLNLEALTNFGVNLQNFNDSNLKKAILNLLPFLKEDASLSYLLPEGEYIIKLLEDNHGYLPQDKWGEVVAFIESSVYYNEISLTEQLLSIYEASKDPKILTALKKLF